MGAVGEEFIGCSEETLGRQTERSAKKYCGEEESQVGEVGSNPGKPCGIGKNNLLLFCKVPGLKPGGEGRAGLPCRKGSDSPGIKGTNDW